MKVIMICRGIYPSVIGGVEMQVYSLIRQLAKSNEVLLIHEGPFRSDTIKNISLSNSIEFNSRGYLALTLIIAICKLLSTRIRGDVIHSQTASLPLLIGSFLSIFQRIPLIVTCHGSEIRVWGRSSWLKYIQRLLFHRCTLIICVSEDIRRILIREYKLDSSKIQVIPNGYMDSSNRHETKVNAKSLVFVGSLRKEKNPFLLLESMKDLVRHDKDIELKMIGSGPLLGQVTEYIREKGLTENVTMLGTLPHQLVLEEISRSDILVLSSTDEGLPVVMLEALALGTPIVATNVGGISEIIKNRESGILVKPGSVQEMTASVLQVLNDFELRQYLSKNGIRASNHLSIRHISMLYANAYRAVITKG